MGWAAAARGGARFARAAGHGDLFYAQDPELPFDEVWRGRGVQKRGRDARPTSPCPSPLSLQLVDPPLPRPPMEATVLPHWLAIEGAQPATPENAPLPVPRARRGARAPAAAGAAAEDDEAPDVGDGQDVVAPEPAAGEGGKEKAGGVGAGGALVRAPVRHALSEELAAYLASAAAALLPDGDGPAPAVAAAAAAAGGAGAPPPPPVPARDPASLRRAVLASLATDPGLHPLAPYLVKMVADGVRARLADADAPERFDSASAAFRVE